MREPAARNAAAASPTTTQPAAIPIPRPLSMAVPVKSSAGDQRPWMGRETVPQGAKARRPVNTAAGAARRATRARLRLFVTGVQRPVERSPRGRVLPAPVKPRTHSQGPALDFNVFPVADLFVTGWPQARAVRALVGVALAAAVVAAVWCLLVSAGMYQPPGGDRSGQWLSNSVIAFEGLIRKPGSTTAFGCLTEYPTSVHGVPSPDGSLFAYASNGSRSHRRRHWQRRDRRPRRRTRLDHLWHQRPRKRCPRA